MIIPIRCFTCNNVIAHLWEKYVKETKKKDVKTVLDEFGLERYCCRTMFMGNVDKINDYLIYECNN